MTPKEEQVWLQGFAVAAAFACRNVGDSQILKEGGFTLGDLRDAGVEAFDFNAIAAAMDAPDRMIDDDNPVAVPSKRRPSARRKGL